MQSLVVFLAVAAVARASLLEPYGYGYSLSPYAYGYGYAAPAVVGPSAVSHQSRVDYSSSPAVISESYAAPLFSAAPVWGRAHLLKKRSLGYLEPIAYSTPFVAHSIAPSAVSHQSRVDFKSSPAVVSESIVSAPVVAAPVVAETYAAPLVAQTYAAPVVAHAIAPSAVSHQSRVDFKSSPAVVSESIVAAPAVTYASPFYGSYGLHSHILKKRSLGYLGPVAYSAPIVSHSVGSSAVTHQSRVDVESSPAVISESIVSAPVVAQTYAAPLVAQTYAAPVVAHAIAPAAVSHQSRVDYKSSPAVISENIVAAPVVHSAYVAPARAYSYFGW